MYDMVPHTRQLLVSGGSADTSNEDEYKLVGVRPSDYEGPTTITYLISNTAEEMDVETRIYVVHLPQYFQVEEDFTGTARLMEILCTIYGLPSRLADQERGRQQYASLQNIVTGTSEVAGLLQRLEERYDRENQGGGASTTPLSPMVEEFLQGLDRNQGSSADMDPDSDLDLDTDDDPSDE
jgi:hypothetical protein